MGKSRFEQLCLEEAETLVEQLLKSAHDSGGDGFDPKVTAFDSVANVLTALVYGKRFPDGDKRLRDIVENQGSFDDVGKQAGALMVFPWLRHIPFTSLHAAWKKVLKLAEADAAVSEPEVRRITEKFSAADEPQCVAEQFLKQRGVKPQEGSSTGIQAKLVRTDNITTNIETIFGAGTDTSVMTIVWATLFFMHCPEVQQKGYEEIKNKIGLDRPVGCDDRIALPYVEAILLEIWRRGNLVPLSVQRRNLYDTHVNGYFIPKHSAIVANLWNVHRDEKHFPEPMTFRPERFIDAETGKIDRSLPLIPFSAGKRACVGEPIARMELFLFLANILQRVEILQPVNSKQLPSLDDFKTGITLHPAPFKINVRSRI